MAAGISTEPSDRYTAFLSPFLPVCATIKHAQQCRSHTSNSLAITGRVSFERFMSTFAPMNACIGSKMASTAPDCSIYCSTSANVMPAQFSSIFTRRRSAPLDSSRPRSTPGSSSTEHSSTLPGLATGSPSSGRPDETCAASAHANAVLPVPGSPWSKLPLPSCK